MSLDQRMRLPQHASASSPKAPVGGDVGAVVVLAVGLALSIALIAGLVDWAVLRSAWWSGALLLVALAGATLVLRVRPRIHGRAGMSGLALALPASAVLVVAAVGAVRGVPDGIAWFLNGDHPRHAVYVADTWMQGNLAYSVEGYPHGWHSLVAAGWSVVGAGLDPASVIRLVQVMAMASLLLSAALTLSMSHLGHALGIRAGLSGRAATAVGLLVGSATLLNVFLANYQALGYQNSLLAATVIAVCAREVLVRAGTTSSVVVSAAGTVVLAHSWQLLLPVIAVTGLWCAVQALRRGGHTAVAIVAAVIALMVGSPAVLAVVQGVGLNHATEAGPDSPVPLMLLGLGLASLVVLALRWRDGPMRCVAAVTALPSLLAALLSVGLGVSLTHYYPSKLLWQSALLGLPWVGVAGALLVDQGGRGRPTARMLGRRAAMGASSVFVIYALLMPWGSQLGSWATVDAGRVTSALRAPGAPAATVVWLGASPTTDSVTRSLLDIRRVAETRKRAPQARLDIAQECALLRAESRPAVLSTEEESLVRARYACDPRLTVIYVGPLRR